MVAGFENIIIENLNTEKKKNFTLHLVDVSIRYTDNYKYNN